MWFSHSEVVLHSDFPNLGERDKKWFGEYEHRFFFILQHLNVTQPLIG